MSFIKKLSKEFTPVKFETVNINISFMYFVSYNKELKSDNRI